MKKRAAVLSLLVLAGCQARPHYPISASLLPPPPQGQPLPERDTAPPPVVEHQPRRVPSYAGTAGALTRANIGRYMDGMENDLRRILKGTPVARPGDMLSLNLRNDTLFEKGSSFSEDGRDLVRALAVTLRHYDRTTVQVNGYTDTRGTPDKSLKTSQSRADAVAAALRAGGVAAARITSTGFGQTHLKLATGPDKAEPRNRRIEIKILPHPG